MEWTGLNELREKYLSFFESKGHLRLASFSLVPKDDDSLLLINSGMAPMKNYFTGKVKPPRKRVTTCQKCIRTPDIDRVGITARHGTYFEMLGNFSFGDYFKREAISFAWEFCTKVINMPIDRLWISIYKSDDEAFNIWTKEIGVDKSHIVRLGKEDNFWEHGAGPCGPCSEIYFDRGEKYGCGSKDCKIGCDCDRYVEFWNLVFTQFNNDGNNNYTPLANPNIDTGMGLERLACIMQDVDNLFLVDTVQNIMKHVCKIANVEYGSDKKDDISLRVITDHIRSTTFMISDGIMPSNEGRGYVLRRLIRRAARHGRMLGINRPFLSEVCETVINENKGAYPELSEKHDFIKKVINVEEESFIKTIDQGMQMLESIIKNSNSKVVSGKDAFKLNDTYGFPIDLTKEIAIERGMTVDEDEFNSLLEDQKKRARQARKNAGEDAWLNNDVNLKDINETEFIGYDNVSSESKVLAIIKDSQLISCAKKGEEVTLILDKTPFYAVSGGQTFDSGSIGNKSFNACVKSVNKSKQGIFLHNVNIESGVISNGDCVFCEIDLKKRHAVMRNHTAAHLLQAALRKVLGTHVEQAGQFVDDEHMRFDFTHFSSLTQDDIIKVENLVNDQILSSKDVDVQIMSKDEAKKMGAMALFGEKYGDVVRVVKINDFSIELCGGTHVRNTSELGLFKIVSESSVASGIRRIEAVTGSGVLRLINDSLKTLNDCAKELKVNNSDGLLKKCKNINLEIKEKDKKIDSLTSKLALMNVETLIKSSKAVDTIKIITADFSSHSGEYTLDTLRIMCDKIRQDAPESVTVLVSKSDGKVNMISSVGPKAQDKGVFAGKIVKEISKLAGGNGGGRKDVAMAGIKDESKIKAALEAVEDVALSMLKDN